MFLEVIKCIHKFANQKMLVCSQWLFFFFFLAFYRRLWFLRIKICNIYISKATAIIRETFQYSRKVQGMFSIKDSMRN